MSRRPVVEHSDQHDKPDTRRTGTSLCSSAVFHVEQLQSAWRRVDRPTGAQRRTGLSGRSGSTPLGQDEASCRGECNVPRGTLHCGPPVLLPFAAVWFMLAGMFIHHVYFWLKPGTSAAEREALARDCRTLLSE